MRQDLEDRVQQAVKNFMDGYSCGQSVLAAFADIYGLDDRTAKLVSSGFGAGVGRLRMMCGTVSALVILAGLDRGQLEGKDSAAKSECYKFVQELLSKFKERNGSVICAELLGINGCKVAVGNYVPDERNAHYYKVRPCAAKVESAARIFAEYLEAKDAAKA